MFFRLGRIVTRFCWLIVVVWIVMIAIALPFAPQATQVLHSGGFVSPDFESEQAINLLVQKLHFDPTIVQVIFTSSRYSADSPAFTQEAQQALTRVLGWSEVSGVISFTDNPRQISLDRHAAYANVLLKADPDNAPKLLPELERRLQAVPDLQTHIGGGPVFFADIQLVSERDLRRAEILAFPFAIIALLLVFRSVVAAILPALVGGKRCHRDAGARLWPRTPHNTLHFRAEYHHAVWSWTWRRLLTVHGESLPRGASPRAHC